MADPKTSRRRFVQLAGGTALALRHGLLPAQPNKQESGPSTRSDNGQIAARLSDAAMRIEWDGNLHARIARVTGSGAALMTTWCASDYLLRADGRHITDFKLKHASAPQALSDANGPGSRLTLVGTCAEGLEKTVTATLYERYPGFATLQVSFRNVSAATIAVQGWTCADFLVQRGSTPKATTPAFWCYSGATYEDRRDWVQPVKHGFAQDNFLGMEASDYGGGTPIVDVWRRDSGLAVGHVEKLPRLVSLPVQEQNSGVRLALSARDKRELAAGETLRTVEAFVSVHEGDHFATTTFLRPAL